MAGSCTAAVLAVALLATAANPASAQRGVIESLGLVVRSWGVGDGLPQATVTGLAQTPDGYLWVTTFGGLARFDGMEFHATGVGEGMPLRLLRPYVDREGTLWVLPETGGLWRRDPRSGAFAEVPSARGRVIFRILVAADSSLWLATAGDGVIRVRGDERRAFGISEGLPSTTAVAVAEDRDGTIWIGTDRGMARFKDGKIAALPAERGFPSALVSALAVRRDGSIIFGTADGRLCRARGDECRCEHLVTSSTEHYVTGIVESRDGAIWVSSSGGLYHVAAGRTVRLGEAEGLDDTSFMSLIEDLDGHLWLGGNVGGLTLLSPRTFAVYGRSAGLPTDQVLAVTVDGNGDPLVGLNCGPVMRIASGRAVPLAPGEPSLDSCVWSLLRDRNGALWAGTWGEGILKWQGNRVRRISTAEGLPEAVVPALYERRSGAIWAGTRGGGACRVDGASPECLTVRDGLVHPDVRGFAETPDGALWIATSGGLSRYDASGIANLTAGDGLRSPLVRALHVDGRGELWVGTYGGGIALVRRGRALSVTSEQGLLDDVVSWIGEDDQGFFWLTGNRGVFRVARSDLLAVAEGRSRRIYPLAFGVEDGMVSQECAGGFQPAGARTPDGRLWIPTLRGLVSVDPRALPRRAPRRAVIESVLVDGRTAISSARLEVPRDMRTLEVIYGGLDLAAARKLIYRYRLSGVDREWVDAGHRSAAYYGNLDPGRYEFAVKAFSPDGGWGPASTPLVFEVPQVFWLSWWFLAALVAGVAVLVYSLGAWRQSVRNRHEREHAEIARRLTAGILHEFRQPLQVLRTRIEILALRSSGDNAGGADTLRSLDRLEALLDRLEGLHSVTGLAMRRYADDEAMADLAEEGRRR